MLHFFVYLFLTHITRVAWTFFASISFTQCLFFFVYVQLLSSPPLIYKLLFFALFARNILIVAREMGHRVFFPWASCVCWERREVLRAQGLWFSRCPPFEPLVSSRKIREKKCLKKDKKKKLTKCCRQSGAPLSSNPGSTHDTHKKSENKGRARGLAARPTTTNHYYQPPHPLFFSLFVYKCAGSGRKINYTSCCKPLFFLLL